MEYQNYLRQIISPFRFCKIKKPIHIIKLASNFTPFDSILLYEEIQDAMKKEGIDVNIYNKCITFPISESYVEDGVYKFLINAAPINTLDIKLLLLHGYIYIFHKDGFTLDNIIFIEKENRPKLFTTNNKEYSDTFISDIELNAVDSNYPTIGIKYEGNFIKLAPGEDLWSIYNKEIEYFIPFLFNIKMSDIFIYNKDEGFKENNNIVDIYPLYVKNKSTNPNDMVFIKYDGILTIDEYNKKSNSLYLKDIFTMTSFPGIKEYFLDDLNRFIPRKNVDYYKDYNNDIELLTEARDFNYDLYIELLKYKGTINHLFLGKDIKFTTKNDTLTNVVSRNTQLGPDEVFIQVSFSNHRKLLPEVFFNGVKFTGYKLVEKFGEITTISIKLDSFMDYYKLDNRSKANHLYVVLRPEDFIEFHYNNIHPDYNGVIPINKLFMAMHHKRIYDNGYIIKEADYTLNKIPPYNLLVSFPRRNFRNSGLTATGYLGRKITKKELNLKYKNLTVAEIADFKKAIPNKYIYSDLLYTDYIDFNYQIYCGPYILMEGLDYIILSSNLIKFTSDLFKYKEDNDNDFIKITIQLEDEENPAMIVLSKKSSYLYHFYNNPTIINKIADGNTYINIKKERSFLDTPARYRDDIYYEHIFLTKYLSTELVLSGEEDIYGEKYYRELEEEFPQYIKTENGKSLILTDIITTPYDVQKDAPRLVTIPESNPLNIIISEDIIAKRKLIHENLHMIENNKRNEMNNEIFSYEPYRKNVDMNFIKGDVKYLDTIPFDAIYDNIDLG